MAKEKEKEKEQVQETEEPKETVPSELDEMTHREVGLIYEDTTRTILFAKGIQWKAVASSLIMFVVVIALVKYISNDPAYIKTLKIAVIFTSMAAIFLLMIFQMWQHTELQKILSIEALFSSVFRDIRERKSKLEASVHRYVILSFMVGTVLLGGYVAIISLDRLGY